MTQMWFTEELETANLGDKRLNERFAQILEALGIASIRPLLFCSTDLHIYCPRFEFLHHTAIMDSMG